MKIDVREAPAGPALDAACAEARGWEVKWHDGVIALYLVPQPDTIPLAKSRWQFRPSTDIAAAWELVEILAGTPGYEVVDLRYCSVGWAFRDPFGNVMRTKVVAETAPLAICRAFLLANGIEKIEIEGE